MAAWALARVFHHYHHWDYIMGFLVPQLEQFPRLARQRGSGLDWTGQGGGDKKLALGRLDLALSGCSALLWSQVASLVGLRRLSNLAKLRQTLFLGPERRSWPTKASPRWWCERAVSICFSVSRRL